MNYHNLILREITFPRNIGIFCWLNFINNNAPTNVSIFLIYKHCFQVYSTFRICSRWINALLKYGIGFMFYFMLEMFIISIFNQIYII